MALGISEFLAIGISFGFIGMVAMLLYKKFNKNIPDWVLKGIDTNKLVEDGEKRQMDSNEPFGMKWVAIGTTDNYWGKITKFTQFNVQSNPHPINFTEIRAKRKKTFGFLWHHEEIALFPTDDASFVGNVILFPAGTSWRRKFNINFPLSPEGNATSSTMGLIDEMYHRENFKLVSDDFSTSIKKLSALHLPWGKEFQEHQEIREDEEKRQSAKHQRGF